MGEMGKDDTGIVRDHDIAGGHALNDRDAEMLVPHRVQTDE